MSATTARERAAHRAQQQLDSSGVSAIADMDAEGNAPGPDPTEYTELDLTSGPISKPDPPGVRQAFVVDDDDALNDQCEELRARRVELSAHVAHTHEAQLEALGNRVRWAKDRIGWLNREFAKALDRNPDALPDHQHATARMMAAPEWAKGVRQAIDDKPRSEPGVRPTHAQVSCYSAPELKALMVELATDIADRERELKRRALRRVSWKAAQEEKALEAELDAEAAQAKGK